jgi:type IV secretion system protein VirD4
MIPGLRRSLLGGTALIAGGLWLAGASWALRQGLAWDEPQRFGKLAYAPWLWLTALPYAGQSAALARWLPLSGALTALPALAAAGLAARVRGLRTRRSLHGDARWATRGEAARSGIAFLEQPDGAGIVLGRTTSRLGSRYAVLHGQEHVALHAKTRAGKGRSFVIPNCLTWQGSLVVLDVKGENYRASAGCRAAMGQAVFLFDPASPSRRTHRWNPLGYVERGSPQAFDQIQRIAYLIIPESFGKEKFWDDAGRSAFIGVAAILAETPDEALTFGNVLRFFARGDGGEALARMVEQRREAGTPHTQAAVDAISDYLNGSVEQVNGIRKTVTSKLQIWYNPSVAAATANSDFDLRDIRRRRMSIFVCVTPGNLRRMRVLLGLLFQQLIELNTDVEPAADPSLRHQVLVMLDEFVRLGKLPVLAEAASYVASYGLRLAYVLQNKAQLRGLYGADGADDILDNVGAEIVFGTSDLKLCEEVSKRLGYDTVDAVSRTSPRWFRFFRSREQNETVHLQRRALLLPQEVAQIPPSEQIVLRAALPPLRTGRVIWYEDPTLKHLHRKPPDVTEIPVAIRMDDGRTRILPGARGKLQPIATPVTAALDELEDIVERAG